MTEWGPIILVWLVSVGLLLAEVFVPGMILGGLGVIGLVVASSLAWSGQGPLAGVAVTLGSILAGGLLAWFGVSRMGHRHVLSRAGGFSGTDDRSDLVGQSGEAITVLRPGGLARIAGRRVDVVTGGEHVEAGTAVVVTKVEGSRVEVRQVLEQ